MSPDAPCWRHPTPLGQYGRSTRNLWSRSPFRGPIGLEGVCLQCDYFRFAVPSMNWVRFLVPVSMVTDRMSG